MKKQSVFCDCGRGAYLVKRPDGVLCCTRCGKSNEREKKSNLILLSGLPGSGKSTLASFLSKKLAGSVVVINRDSIRESISAGHYKFSPEIENGLVKPICVELMKLAIHNRYSLIIDETNLILKQRQFWYDVLSTIDPSWIYHYKTLYVLKLLSEDPLSNRMKDPRGNSREQWGQIIDKMEETMVDPSYVELDFLRFGESALLNYEHSEDPEIGRKIEVIIHLDTLPRFQSFFDELYSPLDA